MFKPHHFRSVSSVIIRLLGAAFIAGIGALTTPHAFAADDINVTVAAGSLAITNPTAADFDGITLNGASQQTTTNLAGYTVTDNRGSGVGWRITAQATQFTEYTSGTYVASGKTLPANSLSMTTPSIIAGTSSSSSPAQASSSTTLTLDSGAAVTVKSAAADSGMGTYAFGSTTLTLTVPANAYAKTFRSDLTISVAAAP